MHEDDIDFSAIDVGALSASEYSALVRRVAARARVEQARAMHVGITALFRRARRRGPALSPLAPHGAD